MTTTLKAFLASGLLLASSVATAETIERDICVFDIAGKVGPTMAAMQDWRTEAMNWGLDANLKVYTNESVVAEDLKAGVCDAALMTGIRARQFNTYAGTLDSIGAIPTMEHMKIALQVLAHPNSAELFFEDCRVPAENLIGAENGGFFCIMSNFQMERLILAVTANMTAQVALDEAMAYAREREAFGRPIAGFQVTRHKLAEMATQVAVSREFTYGWRRGWPTARIACWTCPWPRTRPPSAPTGSPGMRCRSSAAPAICAAP